MKLRAISRFTWRGKTNEIGDEILCPDDVIGKRLIAEKFAVEVSEQPAPEPAAPKESEPATEAAPAAEIAESAPVAKPAKVSKKKKR